MEPSIGLEPITYCLQNSCTAIVLTRQVTKSSGFSFCVYTQSYSLALEDLVNKYQKNKNKYDLTLRKVKKKIINESHIFFPQECALFRIFGHH